MTTTIARDRTAAGTTTSGPGMLLALLHDALSAVEEQDLDLLHARTPAGSALMSLSAITRRAAGALGADPGVHLTDGPGVVVVRDLVAATRLLARAAPSADGSADVGHLVAAAKGVHARLLEMVTSAA